MGKWIYECPICGNAETIGTKTKISGFVKERIESDDIDIQLLHCTNCSFAFYDYRFSPEEEKKLYDMYRSDLYQRQREKHECWYTARVNNAFNNNEKYLKEQQRVIEKVLRDNGYDRFDNALDYGGNEGATYLDKWGIKNKYVYDISGCEVLPNITKIDRKEDIRDLPLDFVMCNMTFEHLTSTTEIIDFYTKIGDANTIFYVEVPSEFPFSINKFSIKNNIGLLLNPNYNSWKLFLYYLKQRKEPFFTMKEHINFYTSNSLKTLIESYGFRTIDIQENYEMGALGKSKVLSILFKRQE